MSDKALPASPEDERAVLGSVLINRDAIIPIAAWLKPAHFYVEQNAWIYEAMLTCYDAHTPPDIRTVADALRRKNRLDAIGGVEYLSDLSISVPTSAHVEYYARTIARLALDRNVIYASATICALGYDEHIEQDQKIAALYAALDGATERPAARDALLPIADVVGQRYADVSEAIERGDRVQIGVPSGLRDLDDLTGGLQKSDLIVLAARPSVGKSSLALCIAANVAAAGYRVDLFSLEMSRKQLLDRMIAIRTGLNLLSVRQWRMSEKELAVYMAALGWAAGLPIFLDDQPGVTVQDIRARVLRRAAIDGLPSLVLIDYLQLMSAGRRVENRVQEVSEMSRGLKNLARELDCPVIALSQLSRAVESRQSKVPMLSDLRESGAIEQDSDIVMFIYREELYEPDTDKKGIAELHIAKHRNGPIGVIPMRFDASTTRFSDLTYRTAEGY